MKQYGVVWSILVLCVVSLAGTVYAQEPAREVTDDDVNRVARELYCPICENTPLDVCETQACEDWRQLIREKLTSGQSAAEIIEYFAEIYGERARATPTTRGLSLLIWIAPIVGAVVGVAYFARLLRRWLAKGAGAASVQAPSSESLAHELEQNGSVIDDYVDRLEQDVRKSA